MLPNVKILKTVWSKEHYKNKSLESWQNKQGKGNDFL